MLLLFPSQAFASFSGAVFAGTGISAEDPGDDLMGPGFGVRAGTTFIVPVYLGVAASIHRGTRDDELEVRYASMDYYGAEAGFQFTLGAFGLRPYLMGGVANVSTTRDVNGGFVSPYFGAGLAPHWAFFDTPLLSVFVGLDVRYVQTTQVINNGDNESSAMGLPLYLHVGASFL